MGLTLRMTLALVAAAVVFAALTASLVLFAVQGLWYLDVFFVIAIGVGLYAARQGGSSRRPATQPHHRPRVEAAVHRLALVAGVPPPEVAIERDKAPLSWTTAAPWRTPTIHVTAGMLRRLDDAQLEAVLAHELAHVVNRDALVMTVVAGAPVAFARGVRELFEMDTGRGIAVGIAFGLYFLPTVVLLLGISRIVSRHRELIADRDAAVMTGSPAAVAGALISLSAIDDRDRDLRDVFHFLPARDPAGVRRFWATHPPLRERLQRLQHMESELQT